MVETSTKVQIGGKCILLCKYSHSFCATRTVCSQHKAIKPQASSSVSNAFGNYCLLQM